MSVAIEEQVLRLQVAVDDRLRVKIVERGHDLGRVEVALRVVEPSGVTEVREELAAADVLEQHVEVVVIVVRPEPTDGRVDRQLDGRVDGWVDGQVDGR